MARKLLSVTVLAMLVAAAFAQTSTTSVNAPTTQVRTQTNSQGQTNTQVRAPGTAVSQTPSGVAVKAPGTTAVANNQGTAVNAPLTTVRTNNQNGATSVRTVGTAVDVAPNGATRVIAPFVGAINVPGTNAAGRKMLRA